MDKKMALKTLRNVTLAGLYIFSVSQIMYHGNDIFGKSDNFLTPFAVLLLFSVSATIVGSLVIGQAVMLYLDKKSKAAMQSAAFSIFWLFSLTILVFIVLAFIK